MKKLDMTSLVLVVLGIIIAILGWTNMFGESSGYAVMFVAFPLILIGIIIWLVEYFKTKKK